MATTGGGEETLRWEGVWCCVRSSARGEWTWILRDCSGVARAGRSLAILGPSGSGKTTLLSHLGGHLNADSRKVWVTGEVSSPPHSVAFVPQDAPFFAKLTVRETLVFIAGLEDTGRPSKERVEDVIRRLGLGGCADSVVGGDGGRGISGGERRRLAIACELLRAESDGALTVLIADEPTTGLDSFQADRVVETLVDLARGEGAMVLMCIHQPRSAIFEKLDDVLLLAPGGRTCYAGPASGALAYFAGKGFPCKPNYNPAEFLVDLVSVDTSSKEAERRAWKRIEALHRAWQSDSPRSPLPEQPAMAAGGPPAEPAEPRRRPRRAGLLSQFFHLVGRAFTQTRREGAVHLTRAAGTVVLALAFGTCHFKLGRSQKSIKRRGAVMMQVCINSAMMSTIKTLNSFPRERCVVKKELAKTRTDGSRLYGIGPYFLSKLLVESPVDAFFPVLFGSIVGPLSGLNPRNRLAFLGTLALQGVSASAVGMSVGALAPSTEAALAVGPVVMVLSIMLGDSGGMFAEVPKFLKPAAKFSLIKWGFDGCSSAEFSGLDFHCDDLDELMTPANGAPDGNGPQGGAKGFLAGLFNSPRPPPSYQREIAEAVCLRTGKQVLEGMGLEEWGFADAAKEQGKLLLYNLCATYLALRVKDGGGGYGASHTKPPIPFERSARKLWEI